MVSYIGELTEPGKVCGWKLQVRWKPVRVQIPCSPPLIQGEISLRGTVNPLSVNNKQGGWAKRFNSLSPHQNAGVVEFGIHRRLKISRSKLHAGSSPAFGTIKICECSRIWYRQPPQKR